MMRYLPAREILHKAMGQIGRISAARFDFFAALLPISGPIKG